MGAPTRSNLNVLRRAYRESISPPEGEMPGRAEGGNLGGAMAFTLIARGPLIRPFGPPSWMIKI